MLTMNAVNTPAKAPSHQPSQPPAVAPRNVTSLDVMAALSFLAPVATAIEPP